MEQDDVYESPEEQPSLDPALLEMVAHAVETDALPEEARAAAKYLLQILRNHMPERQEEVIQGRLLAEMTLHIGSILQPRNPSLPPRVRVYENLHQIVSCIQRDLRKIDEHLQQRREIAGADCIIRVIDHAPTDSEFKALEQHISFQCSHPLFFHEYYEHEAE